MKENNFWPLYTIGAILIIAILSFVYINHQNNQIKDLEDEIAILKAEKDSLEAEIELRKAIKERYGINDYYTKKNYYYPYSAYVVFDTPHA